MPKPHFVTHGELHLDPLRNVSEAVVADSFLTDLDNLLHRWDAHLVVAPGQGGKVGLLARFKTIPDRSLLLQHSGGGQLTYTSRDSEHDAEP